MVLADFGDSGERVLCGRTEKQTGYKTQRVDKECTFDH